MSDSITKYKSLRPLYKSFTDKLVALLKEILDDNGIKYYSIESRTKEIDSFKSKINRVGKKYNNPITEITDLSGVRICLYYLNDIDIVCKLIKNEFTVDNASSINKSDILKSNEFGYPRCIRNPIAVYEKKNW